MRRMRSIKKAAADYKTVDPSTSVTIYYLRKIILSGEFSCRKSGGRYLIDMDKLDNYLTAQDDQEVAVEPESDKWERRQVRKID